MYKGRLLWLLLWISAPLSAAGPITSPLSVGWPQESWHSRESQHFVVHAPTSLKEHLPRVAALAENAHQSLSVKLDWTPRSKTHLVLTDDYDLANGWASIYPFNQNRLYISHPDRFTNLEAYDDWLRLLIEHEYTHTLHLDQAEGAPKTLRSIFGRVPLFFPHLFQPLWLLEGLAMRSETDVAAGVGRGQSSLQAMQMRAEVEAGLVPLARISGQNRDWPPDQAYLYGVFFYQFLDETLGPEAVQAWLQGYRRNLLPFFLNSTARRSLGKDFPELWTDYQHWLEARFAPLESPHPQGTALSQSGLHEAPPTVLGNNIYRLESSRHGPTRLRLYQPDQKPVTLTTLEGQGLIDVNAQGLVIISRYQQRRDNRLYSDLWLWDEKTGLKRLTYGQRYRQARWLPSGELVARKQVAGVSSLHRLNAQGEEVEEIWQGEYGEVLGDFSLSPDGRYLAAGFKPAGQSWQLALMSLEEPSWQLLTQDAALQGQPSFSQDGQSLIFTADYQGVYNLYRLNLETHELVRLTDQELGAFTPVELENASLIFQSYSSRGYDLYRLEANQLLKLPVTFEEEPEQTPREPPPEVALSEARPYRPWSTLRPHFWLPVFFRDENRTELGLMTSGLDALGRHQYDLLAAWDTQLNEPFGSISYQLDNRYQLFASRELKHYQADQQPVLTCNKDSLSLARLNLINFDHDRLAIHAGVFFQQEKELWRDPDLQGEQINYQRQDTGLALHWDRRYASLDSIAPRGFQWLAMAETHELINNDREGQRFQLDGKHYWHLGLSNTLALRLAAGYAEDQAQPFWLGSDQGLLGQPLFGRDTYALRGYADDQFKTQRFGLSSLEYHLPLARIQQNWGIYPLGIRDIYGQMFIDHAEIDLNTANQQGYTGAGAQITVELVIGFQALLPVEIGYAQGLDKELGEEHWWVKAGISF